MENKKPFLSIIMRTQGKRPEALMEALLCLYAQTDMDYEVCLMAHCMEKKDRDRIQKVVSSMPSGLSSRIRILPVTYGGRTAPLHEGFLAARGNYTAAFDDDDLVFEHWVASFHELAKEYPGKILHTYCVQQKWSREMTPYDEVCYTAQGKLQKEYCVDFEYVRQLCVNYCPIHSLAFPTKLYQEMEIRFDETFEVTEDWDFLMRAALVCGVANKAEVTSLYRIWGNYENSKTLNGEKLWEENKRRILDKLDLEPLILPEGSASKIVEYIEQNPMHAREAKNGQKLWMQLFFDLGNGYNEKESIHLWAQIEDGTYRAKVTESLPKKMLSLRIDPGEAGMLVLKNPVVTIEAEDGTRIEKIVDSSNGYTFEEGYLFLEDDPQLYVVLEEVCGMKSLEFWAEYSYEIKAEILDRVVNQLAEKELQKRKSIAYRCKHMIKAVLGK
ncbi:MAG: glycosyltransferase family 2 protein [Lachnospiraceae bacterium]|nr:glycosyltransferase family 2 protein [Lachnospiraceae bacterium]